MNIKLLYFIFADCKKCKYYLPHPEKYYDLAKCKKFELKIQNKTYYEFAEVCRNNNNKCGIEAKEFDPISKNNF